MEHFNLVQVHKPKFRLFLPLSVSNFLLALFLSFFSVLLPLLPLAFHILSGCATKVACFVTCRIDYCNSLLYGLPDYQLAKLQRVQNLAARLVYRESKFCHINPLLKKLHWLPIMYRIRFKIALLTYKDISGLAPSYITDLISIKTCANFSLRSGNELLLNFPLRKSYSTLGDRSFSMAAPNVWNLLPIFIRRATTVNNFKSQFKTYYFKLACF